MPSRKLNERFKTPLRPEQPPTLTPRQSEVLLLYAKGYSIGQIAETLTIASATAARHLKDAEHRLGAKNSANAVYFATKNALIE